MQILLHQAFEPDMASILADEPGATSRVAPLTVIVTGPSAQLVGGQTRHVQMLARIAARLGHRMIHVEVGRRPGERGALAATRRMLADYLRFVRLVRAHRRAGAGCVVHLNSSVQFASLLRELGFLLCVRLAHRPATLVQFHGSLLVHANDRRSLLRGLARVVARMADRLVVLSERQAGAIGGAAAASALVAPNVVEMRPPAPRSPSGVGLRLLYLGRLSAEKGLDLCLAAAARLHEGGRPVRLTVAGEGEYRARFEQRVAERGLQEQVQLLGAVPTERVHELLGSHDLLLFASTIPEGLPYVLLEAMDAALPVVATVTSASMAELVEKAGGAILGVPAESASFVSAVARLAADPQERSRMGELGRAAIERHYSLESAVPLWHEAWGSAATGPGRAAPRDRARS